MATLSELTFDDGTNGASVSESGWATPAIPPVYTTADSAHGAASMEIPDLSYGSIGYNVTGRTAWRLRTYVKWNGSQSGHIFIVRLNTGTWNASSPANGTYGGDVSIRNVDGGKLTCRWNYDSTNIAASAMTANVFTRVDLHWSSAAGMTLRVYETADDTTVDYTLTDADAAGAAITGLWLGKENTNGGIVRHDSVALTEGEDPGPYSVGGTDHTATPSAALGMTDLAVAAKSTIWPVTRTFQIG